MARYKHIAFKSGALEDLKPTPRKPKELTPRQRAQLERDDEIKAAINEAAVKPASEWAGFELKDDQKLPTMRAAVLRILKTENRDINFAVRGRTFIFSKGDIPGRRGGRVAAG